MLAVVGLFRRTTERTRATEFIALASAVRVAEFGLYTTSLGVRTLMATRAEDDAFRNFGKPPSLAPRPNVVRLLLRYVAVMELECFRRAAPLALLLREEESTAFGEPTSLIVSFCYGIGIGQLPCPRVAP